jgi:polygalacturonase
MDGMRLAILNERREMKRRDCRAEDSAVDAGPTAPWGNRHPHTEFVWPYPENSIGNTGIHCPTMSPAGEFQRRVFGSIRRLGLPSALQTWKAALSIFIWRQEEKEMSARNRIATWSTWGLLALAAGLIPACGGGGGSSGTSHTEIPLATGHGLAALPEAKAPFFKITDFGAVPDGPAVTNQIAINNAIDAAAAAGGGTVLIPSGTFKSYSIRLKSNVGIHFEAADSILRAAEHKRSDTDVRDGGVYDAPEANLWIGLQDHGHSHWKNSLIWGIDVQNVLISGPGLIDGGYIDPNTGYLVNVLSGNDPGEVANRNDAGTAAGANKAIALLRADNIVFRDFKIKNGGHFAIIGTEVVNWTMDKLIIDTNRDALDVDSSQNVTIRNSVFNSLTDDAIVLKGSFGGGRYFATRNVLIEDCTVSGYDAGSVLAGVYSTNKKVATDLDGPTARIKLGTEGTTGFDTITIRRVLFDRSRGFALESVDGAELKNIVFTDSEMKNVSSSPIFIRIGDRGRAPVTGLSATDEARQPQNNVRLDNTEWILPNLEKYGIYPPVRYIPSYTKDNRVTIAGAMTGAQVANINIVNPATPVRLNANSVSPGDPLYANAVGVGFARVYNIKIDNIKITDVDPRYPILLAGLVDHPIENVSISNVSVEYRGGLKMEHAIEQRQLNQPINYTSYESAPLTQNVPWLVNQFFAKAEALLPRISWDETANSGNGAWKNDPYNVPEMPREYPEPSLFGVLPSYGIYARHVKGLTIDKVQIGFKNEDERPAVVLDDVDSARFTNFSAQVKAGVPVFVKVTNTKKRTVDREYVPNEPYKTTTVSDLTIPADLAVQEVTVSRPAPGTPPDALYALPTAPSAAAPYDYAVDSAAYPKPVTVYPDIQP